MHSLSVPGMAEEQLQSDPLGHSVPSQEHWCDIVGRKETQFPTQTSFPPGWVGAVQDLQDVSAAEAQLVVLQRIKVIQGTDPERALARR